MTITVIEVIAVGLDVAVTVMVTVFPTQNAKGDTVRPVGFGSVASIFTLGPPKDCDPEGVQVGGGVAEGVTVGVAEGVTVGVAEGVTVGVAEGVAEGVTHGSHGQQVGGVTVGGGVGVLVTVGAGVLVAEGSVNPSHIESLASSALIWLILCIVK